MGLFDGQNSIDAFEDLLDREKRMILRGDVESVARLATEKERLLRRLSRLSLKRERLAALRRRAEHNQHLLEASAKGFRAVQERLRSLTEQRANLKTYGSDGQRKPMGRRDSGFNKRA